MRRIDLNVDDLVKRYQSGQSLKSISDDLGISRPTLLRRLREAGVPIRGRSEAESLKWSQMTPDQRANQVGKAHAAVRGVPKGQAWLEARAAARVRRTSAGEQELLEMLRARGLDPEVQFPVGKYNLDLAVRPVAVEIHVQTTHPFTWPRQVQRIEDILRHHWLSLYVWLKPGQVVTEAAADQVVALMKLARREPALHGKYRVIRADGQDTTLRRLDVNNGAVVPVPIRGKDLWGHDLG